MRPSKGRNLEAPQRASMVAEQSRADHTATTTTTTGAHTMSYLLPNGDLVLTAGNAMRHTIADALRSEGYAAAEQAAFDAGERVNISRRSRTTAAWLELIRPEAIGALTDAPILAEVNETDENTGEPTDVGLVFWFPDYMIRDPLAELARTGRVVFRHVE